jgi:hypothetical protein
MDYQSYAASVCLCNTDDLGDVGRETGSGSGTGTGGNTGSGSGTGTGGGHFAHECIMLQLSCGVHSELQRLLLECNLFRGEVCSLSSTYFIVSKRCTHYCSYPLWFDSEYF